MISVNSGTYCCTCAGTCCHTGPHIYCEKHMIPQLRILADMVSPCPSCSLKDAHIKELEEEARAEIIGWTAQASGTETEGVLYVSAPMKDRMKLDAT